METAQAELEERVRNLSSRVEELEAVKSELDDQLSKLSTDKQKQVSNDLLMKRP